MITRADLWNHKMRYSGFNYDRIKAWLDKEDRWEEFKTVAAANRAYKTYRQMHEIKGDNDEKATPRC